MALRVFLALFLSLCASGATGPGSVQGYGSFRERTTSVKVYPLAWRHRGEIYRRITLATVRQPCASRAGASPDPLRSDQDYTLLPPHVGPDRLYLFMSLQL
jgi:hypothetical protein